MTKSTEIVDINKDGGSSFADMFSDLPELNQFDLKKDEIAIQLAALMSFSEKSRSTLAQELNWTKSRISSVLSGRGNPTIRTIWDFCSVLGYDFDVVFRLPGESRPDQPWQKVSHIPLNWADWFAEAPQSQPTFKVEFTFQTTREVAANFIAATLAPIYLKIEGLTESSPASEYGQKVARHSFFTPIVLHRPSPLLSDISLEEIKFDR